MTRKNGGPRNEEHLRQGSPVNTLLAESFPRYLAGASVAVAASGAVISVGVPLQNGDTVTSITFVTGATAANGPTAGYAGLRSPAGALLGQTADFATTARAANTAYTIALVTPVQVTAPGIYYVDISFTVSTTVPTLSGLSVVNAVNAGAIGLSMKILAQTHGSAVGAVAPATIVSPTTVATIPYVALS